MTQEFRIVATMTFANAADRDAWYTAIKAAVIAAKPTKPPYKQANMTADDYYISTGSTEAV
jgi:hypothetical protein